MSQQSRVAAILASSEFWKSRLEGYNATSMRVEEELPRLMGLLNGAIGEANDSKPAHQHYSLQGVLAALSIIQQQATADALLQVAEEMEREREEMLPVVARDYRAGDTQ